MDGDDRAVAAPGSDPRADVGPRAARRWLAAAVVAGLVLRLAFALVYWVGQPLTRDEREYLSLARSLAAGRGFVYDAVVLDSPVQPFGRSPGYPAFLAMVGGGSRVTTAVPTAVKVAQSVVGAIGVLLIGLIASRVAGARAGVAAACIAAVYPPLVWLPAYAYSEALFWPVGLGIILLIDRLARRPSLRLTLVCGLVIGAAILVRGALTLVVPLAMLWLVVREFGRPRGAAPTGSVPKETGAPESAPTADVPKETGAPESAPTVDVPEANAAPESAPTAGVPETNAAPESARTAGVPETLGAPGTAGVRRGVVAALVLAIGVALVLLPWGVRNYRRDGRFVLVASEGGVTFWTGNNALARGEGDMAANPAIKRASQALHAAHPTLTEDQLEPIYYQEAFTWIRTHPADWLWLEVRKVFYLVVPIGPSYTLHSSRYLVASVVSYGLLLALAIAGLVVGGRRWGATPGTWLMLAAAVAMCLVFFPQERFRLPVIDPVLILFAGAALARAGARS
jgi:hypothetical protein